MPNLLHLILKCACLVILVGSMVSSALSVGSWDTESLSWNLAPFYEIGENTYASSLADINSDGNMDLLVINSADLQQPRIYVLYSDHAGRFTERVTHLLNFSPSAVAAGDLNSDNR